MPRYAILHHNYPSVHWDLLLETGETLRSWRLDAVPESDHACMGVAIPDHRSVYLDYEGPISRNRGMVTRYDRGTFDWTIDQLELLVIRVTGEQLSGTLTLRREPDDDNWLVTYQDERLTP